MSDGQIPIGRRIGKFVIEGQLGRGSRGVVWKARDENGFSVALKILQKECADFEEGFQKFQWETEILKRLNFPGIRRFVEFGEEADCVYLALEYVEGISLGDLVYEPIQENLLPLSQEHHLEELIERISKKWMNLSVIEKAAEAACRPQIGRSFPEAVAVDLMLRICQVVGKVHRCGVIHRDLKPGNILLNRNGYPVIVDFDLAKIRGWHPGPFAGSGRVIGTPENLAPEQAEDSDRVDERADVYSLGTIFYLLLTGRRYFEATGNLPTDLELLKAHKGKKIREVRANIREDVEEVCMRALSKDFRKRYRNAIEFAEALEEIQATAKKSCQNEKTGLLIPSRRTKKTKHINLELVTALILVGMVFGGIGILQNYFGFHKSSNTSFPREAPVGNKTNPEALLTENAFTLNHETELTPPEPTPNASPYDSEWSESQISPVEKSEIKELVNPQTDTQSELILSKAEIDSQETQAPLNEEIAPFVQLPEHVPKELRKAFNSLWQEAKLHNARIAVEVKEDGWILQIEEAGKMSLEGLKSLPLKEFTIKGAKEFQLELLVAENLKRLEILDSTLQLESKPQITFSRLERLSLRGSPLQTLDWLPQTPELKELDLANTGLVDINGLKAPKLRKLDITGTALRTIVGISRFPLRELIVDERDAADARRRLLFLRYMPTIFKIRRPSDPPNQTAEEFWQQIGIGN